MSSEYFAVLVPNLLKKQPFPFMVFQFFPFTWCSVFSRGGFSSVWGVGVLFQPGSQTHMEWETWLGITVMRHFQLVLCQWSCGNFCWATVEAELCSFSPWCFSREHWAFAIPKQFQELCVFQDVGSASVQTSAVWHLQSQDPQCRLAFLPWRAWVNWADSKGRCIQNENMVFYFVHFSAVPVWNVICSSTFPAGEEVTDLKRQAVEEMMDRIKKGVHLRPVNQSSRPKTKVWNK